MTHRPPRRDHRLGSAGSEIDDSKTLVTEGNACIGIDPDAAVVGPTVHQCRGHRRRQSTKPIGAGRRCRVEDAGYPAHAGSAQPSAQHARNRFAGPS